jgi:hypothetical protein
VKSYTDANVRRANNPDMTIDCQNRNAHALPLQLVRIQITFQPFVVL